MLERNIVYREQSELELETSARERDKYFDMRDLAAKLVIENMELQNRETELKQQALIDRVTGVNNRAGLELLLEEKVNELERKSFEAEAETAFSMLCLDLDDFKDINNRYGHLFGDQVLSNVAQVLSGRLRTADFIGRYGGDEFVIGLNDTGAEAAVSVAEELVELVSHNPVRRGRQAIGCTISIGISSYHDNDSWQDLFNRADQALMESKSTGKNRIKLGDVQD